jgi:uncharacterized protein YndB with AHSA1/START domain
MVDAMTALRAEVIIDAPVAAVWEVVAHLREPCLLAM